MLFGNEDSEAFYFPVICHVDIGFRELLFPMAQEVRQFLYCAHNRNRRKVCEEIRFAMFSSSMRTREKHGTTAMVARGIANEASGRQKRERTLN